MAKTWVLDYGPKGTGAELVPLEKYLEQPEARPEHIYIRPAEPRPEPDDAPPSRKPPLFKVVDVMTREVLAEDANARQTVDLLEDVRSIVDVNIYARHETAGKWRALNPDEKRLIWGFRGRG
jgi:hypothetical protein